MATNVTPLASARRLAGRWKRALKWRLTGREFIQDGSRYRRFAAESGRAPARMTDSQLEAQLTKDYHRVEKGLALRDPRRPFGAEVQARLNKYLPEARARQPEAAFVRSASTALEALDAWNSGGERDMRVAPVPVEPASGPRIADPSRFFHTRHSVRHFKDTGPSDRVLREAVEIATRSPSVCNRQPWLIRFYRGREKEQMLRHQNGNRGFGDEAPVVALITVDLGFFAGAGERNQAWIEGGIFSSTFVWALHALGLDSCMLNLSLPNREADELRKAGALASSEVPIMMIAIGHAAAESRVANSERRSASAIIRS